MKKTLTQFSRYAIVGLASNAIGYVLYIALTGVGLGPKLSMSLLYGIGILQTFLFNKRWTFGHRGAHRLLFARYCFVYGLGYVVNLLALILLVDQAGLRHQWVQGVMIVVVAVLLFAAQRYWVFSEELRSDAA